MIKNKKVKDVQFYQEVGESSLNLGKVHRLTDREEEEAEMRDRKIEKQINKQFKAFCDRVEKMDQLNYEEPDFDRKFMGIPSRDNITLLPSGRCLINITETPFIVLSLEDVHIAFFERVQLNLSSFDLVFIMKDFTAKEFQIKSIPRESLEKIKDWLDENNIKFYQSERYYSWNVVLDELRKKPQQFWERGGWKYYVALDRHDDDSDDDDVSTEYNPKNKKK